MRQYRADSVPVPDSLRQYVTAEDAHKHLIGQQSGAEQARLRMLQRMGLDRENGPAADARRRMIEKRERRGR